MPISSQGSSPKRPNTVSPAQPAWRNIWRLHLTLPGQRGDAVTLNWLVGFPDLSFDVSLERSQWEITWMFQAIPKRLWSTCQWHLENTWLETNCYDSAIFMEQNMKNAVIGRVLFHKKSKAYRQRGDQYKSCLAGKPALDRRGIFANRLIHANKDISKTWQILHAGSGSYLAWPGIMFPQLSMVRACLPAGQNKRPPRKLWIAKQTWWKSAANFSILVTSLWQNQANAGKTHNNNVLFTLQPGRNTGWWFEPLWKIWKSIGMMIIPQYMGK